MQKITLFVVITFCFVLSISSFANQSSTKTHDLKCIECEHNIQDGETYLNYIHYYFDDDEKEDLDIVLCYNCACDSVRYMKRSNYNDQRELYCASCGKLLDNSLRNFTNYIIDDLDLDIYICDRCFRETREITAG